MNEFFSKTYFIFLYQQLYHRGKNLFITGHHAFFFLILIFIYKCAWVEQSFFFNSCFLLSFSLSLFFLFFIFGISCLGRFMAEIGSVNDHPRKDLPYHESSPTILYVVTYKWSDSSCHSETLCLKSLPETELSFIRWKTILSEFFFQNFPPKVATGNVWSKPDVSR